jgi:hypothetical protein
MEELSNTSASSTGLDAVANFLNSGVSEEDVYGLNARKVLLRATLVEASEHPGCIVFEMERHEAAMGSVNRKCVGMNAFVTRHYRYVYDPSTRSIDREDTGRPARLDVDTSAVADEITFNFSFAFEHLGGRLHKCTEISTGEFWEVSAKSQLAGIARDVLGSEAWETDIDLIEVPLSAEKKERIAEEKERIAKEKERIAKEIADHFAASMLEKLESSWEEYRRDRRESRGRKLRGAR